MKQKGSVWVGVLAIIFHMGCATLGDGKTAVTHQPQFMFTEGGGKTTGPLKMTRIELNFSNHRGDITVPMHSKILPYAIIRFDGNGSFQAVWEVDGRALETIAVNVAFGKTLTLHTGPGTTFPTFEPGPHSLTLKVKQPIPKFKIPVIQYFVTGEKYKQD